MRKIHNKTNDFHVVIFGSAFLFIVVFVFWKVAESVVLDPANMIIHTNVVYYDGKFSDTNKFEDTRTALYVMNESEEAITAAIYEYDTNGKQKETDIQIAPHQNQFVKTEGPGVVYLNNADYTSSSTIKFSRWAVFKRYTQ